MRRQVALAVAGAVALIVSAPRPASAQGGCVVVRPNVPITIPALPGGGAAQGPYLDEGVWQVSLGYRWFRSDRDYSGASEDEQRAALQAEDINDVHGWTADVAYGLTKRLALGLTLPYQVAERSEPIYTPDGARVLARNRTAARGIGDASVSARAWVVAPDRHPPANLLLSLGVKLPTGQDNATDSFRSATAPTAVRTVDASIQPGDGGIGFLLGMQGFATFGRVSPYLSATYLLSPRETNGVNTYLPQPAQAFLSVPDGYLVRAGSFVEIAGGFAAGLGARLEGAPVKDLIGGSGGFRRPGYVASIEPTVAFTRGAWSLSGSVPIAFLRNRLRSVPEREDGTRGHAAFADYAVLLGVSYRFGGRPEPTDPLPPAPPAPALVTRIGALPLDLRRIDGLPSPVALGSRLTVVNVWASWCAPCLEELPLLDELRGRYAQRGVAFIGVSVDDDDAAAQRLVAALRVGYPMVRAPVEDARALGVEVLPATILLDGDGAIVARHQGALERAAFTAWLDEVLDRKLAHPAEPAP